MRIREARSSSVRARSISWRRSASSAARRSVMSNSAPSIHSRPPGPGTSWPRSRTQRTAPSARTIRYSATKARSGSAPAEATAREIRLRSRGWTMLSSVRFALATKSTGGYPEMRSISSLMSSRECPACHAER